MKNSSYILYRGWELGGSDSSRLYLSFSKGKILIEGWWGSQHRLSPIHRSKHDAFIRGSAERTAEYPAKAAGCLLSVKLLRLLRQSGQCGREGFVSFLRKNNCGSSVTEATARSPGREPSPRAPAPQVASPSPGDISHP